MMSEYQSVYIYKTIIPFHFQHISEICPSVLLWTLDHSTFVDLHVVYLPVEIIWFFYKDKAENAVYWISVFTLKMNKLAFLFIIRM